MSRVLKLFAVLVLCCTSLSLAQEMPEGRLMRFPDIHQTAAAATRDSFHNSM